MHGSGKLGTLLIATLLLAGCAYSENPATESEESPSEARSCPEGLGQALSEHLESRALAASESAELVQVELDPDFEFSPAAVQDLLESACVLRVESPLAGEIRLDVIGIAAGSADEVASMLEAEGWTPPTPQDDSPVFSSPDLEHRLTVVGADEVDPVLGFDDWSSFFDETSTVLYSPPI